MKKVLIAGMLALGTVVVPAVAAQETGPVVKAPETEAVIVAPSVVVGKVAVRTLAKGLTFETTFKDQISSQRDKVGDILTGIIVADVNDSTGKVIFPAKSTATIEIMEIKGTDTDHQNGTLVLLVRSVNVGNQTFRVRTARDSVSAPTAVKGRDWTREPKKMETPAATGAIMSPAPWAGVVGRAPKDSGVGTNLVVTPGTAVRFEVSEAVAVTN